MDIVQVCVKMLNILTEMYKRDSLTIEEYNEHTAIKAAFLSDQLGSINDAEDRRYAMELLRACRDITTNPVMEARY